MKRKMETKAPVKRYQGLNRDYWLYWFASSLGMGASNILQYVLSLYVLEMTGSATLFASMLSIIIFPRILLTPLAGVLADRTRKIRLMSLILLGEAVLLAVYFRLGQTFTMGILWIYALVILLEIGEVFYGGCSSAILPELVPAEKLEDAISISKVDDGIVRVIAPMAAALIYDNMSIASAFAVIGMLNFLSFVLQRLIHPKYENQHPASVQRPSVWESFMEGIHCIRNNAFLRSFIKVLPIANAFFGATFSVSIAYLLRESYAVDTYTYSLYCSITSAVSMVVPMFAVPIVKKYPAKKIFFVATASIAFEIAMIGIFALLGTSEIIPVALCVVLITILDCLTIAAAMPMQMASSILLQTGVEKSLLGRVSATIRMISIASVAVGEMLFGFLNDVTWVWLPIFVGSTGVGFASLLFSRTMASRQSAGR